MPAVRENHSAVWRGAEMFVWGGDFTSRGMQYLNAGGRYITSNPWPSTCQRGSPRGS